MISTAHIKLAAKWLHTNVRSQLVWITIMWSRQFFLFKIWLTRLLKTPDALFLHKTLDTQSFYYSWTTIPIYELGALIFHTIWNSFVLYVNEATFRNDIWKELLNEFVIIYTICRSLYAYFYPELYTYLLLICTLSYCFCRLTKVSIFRHDYVTSSFKEKMKHLGFTKQESFGCANLRILRAAQIN